MNADGSPPRPRVVIVGAGFGGLVAALRLAKMPVDITVVDRANHHLFQPLLYQVATAGLSPADIAAPIRHILYRKRNVSVILGEVTAIDPAERTVTAGRRVLPYEYLIVATGATHAYPNPEWEAHAPGLKTVEDATSIRGRILMAFERAEAETDPEEQRRLLNFIVVGGGPTGVEMAGAIAELAKRVLTREFRNIDPASAQILLLEGGPRLLAGLPEKLSAYARRALEKLGVEVRTDVFAESIDAEGVVAGGDHIESRTVIWAAGVRASPAGDWLGAKTDKAGRVIVEPDLSVPGHPDVFVIGDTAAVTGDDGEPVPGIAPAAKQMGDHAAKVIERRLAQADPPGPFRYKHQGDLATIGRSAAVADFGRIRMTGFVGWLLWSLVHVLFLIGFRNKVVVMSEWIWAYLTFKKGMRLITHRAPDDRMDR